MARRLLRRMGRRDVVIFGDRDVTKYRPDGTPFWPGQDRAVRLAEEIRTVCRTLRVVIPPVKDARDWKANGATHAVVQATINSRVCFVPSNVA